MLVAMSGGVDSSVAAALLVGEGHDVVAATMKLWGGAGDSGCCSVGDVDDARRCAAKLGIDHHVFNFSEEFERRVVGPYVADHGAGRTPNPCIECNRHLKFRTFLDRAVRLGFDAMATGHHARVLQDGPLGRSHLCRGLDRRKDQSYVLSMLTAAELDRVLLPVGSFTKDEVRAIASKSGLPTAAKPDSQEVCFIAGGSGRAPRERFFASRLELHPGEVVEESTGTVVGSVPAVELVTVGQRRGLGGAASAPRYAIEVDTLRREVIVGTKDQLMADAVALSRRTWVHGPIPDGKSVLAQSSAHGPVHEAELVPGGIRYRSGGVRRVAPGQTVALYEGEEVVGSGVAS